MRRGRKPKYASEEERAAVRAAEAEACRRDVEMAEAVNTLEFYYRAVEAMAIRDKDKERR